MKEVVNSKAKGSNRSSSKPSKQIATKQHMETNESDTSDDDIDDIDELLDWRSKKAYK